MKDYRFKDELSKDIRIFHDEKEAMKEAQKCANNSWSVICVRITEQLNGCIATEYKYIQPEMKAYEF